jgi:hypothetical protein
MKTTKFILLLILMILITNIGCKDDNIDSGIQGYIEYGEVDCSLDRSFWTYYPYNGTIYVISEDSVSGSTGNYIEVSDSTQATDGEFVIGLDPGHYYVFIEEYQVFNSNNEITVYLNQTAKPDFYFYSCQ